MNIYTYEYMIDFNGKIIPNLFMNIIRLFLKNITEWCASKYNNSRLDSQLVIILRTKLNKELILIGVFIYNEKSTNNLIQI